MNPNIKDNKFMIIPLFTFNPVIKGYDKQNNIIKQINKDVIVILLSFCL